MLIAALLLLLALLLWYVAGRARRSAGLPEGRVIYSDTGAWGRPEQPLFSRRLQLTGKPDYLVRQGEATIPVEVKSGPAPGQGPYPAHVYQLAAYCALVAETTGRRPAYGLIRYADRTVAVDFTPRLEAELEVLLEAMRADAGDDDVGRSHNSPARCRGCGFRETCGEAL